MFSLFSVNLWLVTFISTSTSLVSLVYLFWVPKVSPECKKDLIESNSVVKRVGTLNLIDAEVAVRRCSAK